MTTFLCDIGNHAVLLMNADLIYLYFIQIEWQIGSIYLTPNNCAAGSLMFLHEVKGRNTSTGSWVTVSTKPGTECSVSIRCFFPLLPSCCPMTAWDLEHTSTALVLSISPTPSKKLYFFQPKPHTLLKEINSKWIIILNVDLKL